jgi:hypothetical protein
MFGSFVLVFQPTEISVNKESKQALESGTIFH